MNKEQIIEWMRKYVAKHMNVPENKIECNLSFKRYGMDSLELTALLGDLSEKIGFDLELNEIFNHPTMVGLAERVSFLISQHRMNGGVHTTGT